MTKSKKSQVIVIESGEEDDVDDGSCPHDGLTARSCPECLTEAIEALGAQLDSMNEFNDELVEEINQLDKIYYTSVLVREELKKSLNDPKRKLGAAVMMKLLEPVFQAVDDYEASRKIVQKLNTDDLN